MQLRQLIQPGITASMLAHALLLGLVVLFSEVHPFGTVTAEPIVVDLVTPDEAANRPDQPEPDRPKPESDKLQLRLPKEDAGLPPQEAASAAPSPPVAPAAKEQQRTARA